MLSSMKRRGFVISKLLNLMHQGGAHPAKIIIELAEST